MRVFPLALVVAVGVACSKDSSAPNVVPQTLVRVAGNGQFWIVGAPLPAPLRVRVTGSDAQPLAGATVSWAVTAGSATVGAASSQTDSLGIAATTVTLGAVAESVAVRASVTGLPPVTFAAAACAVSAFTLGATLPAALATTDCRANGFYTDVYSLDLTSGQQGLTISDSSSAFDTYLELYRGNGARAAVNDDIALGVQNSLIAAIVAPGSYILAPSSYDPDTTGAYGLSVLSRPQALAGCDIVWVTRGVAISDSVTAADCVALTGGPYYADVVALFLEAGSVLKVLHQSTAFDAALFLLNGSSVSVASNNDSANATGTTTNAYLVYQVAQTGAYLLFVGTNTSSATGAYTLTISAATTLSGSARREGPEALQVAPLRMPKGLPQRGWLR